MKVLNIHQRILDVSKLKVEALLSTLSTENDLVWPMDLWPKMKFKNGIGIGATGGHGPIRYSVEQYDPKSLIQFRFSKPVGFLGIHKFEVIELSNAQTEIKHTIDMQTSVSGTLVWSFAIRSLHDALIEDAFDKIENNFAPYPKSTEWSLWVRILRKILS